jgi:iron complex transport system substrate-binding protein
MGPRRPVMVWCGALVLAAGLFAADVGAQPVPIHLTDDRGKALTLAAPARRVVTLLPSLAETVCELGACARLVGTDRHANWPVIVRALPKLGGLEDTQIERLVALKPDLVLSARSTRALDRLEALGLPVLALEPQSLADTARVVRTIALALGDAAGGEALVARLETRIAAAAARIPAALRGQRVYFEVASTPHAAGEASFVGELLARLALGNIAPASLGPFPQLSPEFVLREKPAIVMGTANAVAEMPRRPGWSRLDALAPAPAKERGRACGFAPDKWDTLVRPGPRLAEGAEAIAACLAGLEPR